MFKVGQIVAKTTLSKIVPVSKVVGKAALSSAIKLPLTLAKMSSSLLPMFASAILGGIYLLIKIMK
jgi:hypothetical protein